jgi:hypothetical protein
MFPKKMGLWGRFPRESGVFLAAVCASHRSLDFPHILPARMARGNNGKSYSFSGRRGVSIGDARADGDFFHFRLKAARSGASLDGSLDG